MSSIPEVDMPDQFPPPPAQNQAGAIINPPDAEQLEDGQIQEHPPQAEQRSTTPPISHFNLAQRVFILPPLDATIHPDDMGREEYPLSPSHASRMIGETPEVLPTNMPTAYLSPAPFPIVPQPIRRLLAKMEPQVRQTILDSPGDYVAGIPYGAGRAWAALNPDYPCKLEDFFRGYEGMDSEKIEVRAPWPEQIIGKHTFEDPMVYVISELSPEMRRFLIWQGWHVVNPELTFLILPFEDHPSWIYATFTGPAISRNPEKIKEALTAIKTKAIGDPELQAMAATAAAENGFPVSGLEALYDATVSWAIETIEYVPKGKDESHCAPAWVLTGKPIFGTSAAQKRFYDRFRKLTFYVKITKLILDGTIFCDWCKSPLHSTAICSLPDADPNWPGLSSTGRKDFIAQVERLKKRNEDSHREDSRYAPRARTNAHSGNSGSKRSSRGSSWTRVGRNGRDERR